jgi:hypothetical protein
VLSQPTVRPVLHISQLKTPGPAASLTKPRSTYAGCQSVYPNSERTKAAVPFAGNRVVYLHWPFGVSEGAFSDTVWPALKLVFAQISCPSAADSWYRHACCITGQQSTLCCASISLIMLTRGFGGFLPRGIFRRICLFVLTPVRGFRGFWGFPKVSLSQCVPQTGRYDMVSQRSMFRDQATQGFFTSAPFV